MSLAKTGVIHSLAKWLKSTSTVLASTNGSVPAEELKNAVVSFYGKAPTPRVLNAVVDAYVDVKGQTVKVTAPAVKVNVTLDAPQISEKYYIIGTIAELKNPQSNRLQKCLRVSKIITRISTE